MTEPNRFILRTRFPEPKVIGTGFVDLPGATASARFLVEGRTVIELARVELLSISDFSIRLRGVVPIDNGLLMLQEWTLEFV